MTLNPLHRMRLWDRQLPIWYDADYRLPLTAFGRRTGLEPRRADLVAWYLLEWKWLERDNLRAPVRARYQDLARVHTEAYLGQLGERDTLARIFGVDPWDVPVDEVMRTVRLGTGGTLAAARESLSRGGPAVNLLGGFHHAGPAHGSGLCAVNDIAIAIAVLRAEGFAGRVAILDLDAHPPDGTAACLRGDERVWIGSLSGSSSGSIPGVDEVVLPAGCRDHDYLQALDALLARVPSDAELAFVIAGGDVLAGDHLGHLGLTLDGTRRRDLHVAKALAGTPSVWLPGGGYHADAWKVLAGTVLALMWHTRRAIRPGADPMAVRFARLSRRLRQDGLMGSSSNDIDFSDVEVQLGLRPSPRRLLLDTYTAEGLEFGLYRLGLLAFLERRGYGGFRFEMGTASSGGERLRVYGTADGVEHMLVESVLDRKTVGGAAVLYVEWLTLRDPRARFSERRPRFPGQDAPGLGLAREVTGLLALVAKRLGLAGLAFNPAHYHTAYVARSYGRFIDAVRQGRFEALVRDLGHLPLADVSQAIEAGRVRLNGEPFVWEAEPMAYWLDEGPPDPSQVAEERDRSHFTLEPGVDSGGSPDRAEE
ncbi:MAG: Histone deacetylase superfamily [Acidobacteria bacterium]|nr:Histone deacetylase superfamily [Acidobacteriota bacterium]